MDLKSTIAIILKDLEEARNILDDLKNYPDVPAFQIELAKAKCRSAEEVIKVLGDLEAKPVVKEESVTDPEPRTVNEDKKEDSIVLEQGIDNIASEEKKEKPEEDELLTVEPESKETVIENVIDQVVQPASDKSESEVRKKEGQILADKFSRQASLNEQLGSKRQDEENSEPGIVKPVENLNDAIGLNEKFMFIRELFDGNQDLYRKTLDKLNETTDIDSAFNELSRSISGNSDSEAFDILLDLVKRKLSSKR